MKKVSSQENDVILYDSQIDTSEINSLVHFEIIANAEIPEELQTPREIREAKQQGQSKLQSEIDERYEVVEYSEGSYHPSQEVSSEESDKISEGENQQDKQEEENTEQQEENIEELVNTDKEKSNKSEAIRITAYNPKVRFIQLVARYNIDQNQQYNKYILNNDDKKYFITEEQREASKRNRTSNGDYDHSKIPWRVDATTARSPYYDDESNGKHMRDDEKVTMYDEPTVSEKSTTIDSKTGKPIYKKDKVKFVTFLMLDNKAIAQVEWSRVTVPELANGIKWSELNNIPDLAHKMNQPVTTYKLTGVKIFNPAIQLPKWAKNVLNKDADARHFSLKRKSWLSRLYSAIFKSKKKKSKNPSKNILTQSANRYYADENLPINKNRNNLNQDDNELVHIQYDRGQVKESTAISWKKPSTGLRSIFSFRNRKEKLNIKATDSNKISFK